jgi:glyoxylase-like metal-dependent hydrolase (beta-lactamase superfamily II)
MNRDECLNAMHSSLKELGVNLKETDFFITHMHSDHSGLISSLATERSTVYCTTEDAEIINADDIIWDNLSIFVDMGGFPFGEFKEAIEKHPGYKYRCLGEVDFTPVSENDMIHIGAYSFRCIETPGHTRGHICLYEAEKKILVSGDHILSNITPNISLWSDDEDPLSDYLESLEKLNSYPVTMVLPGHRVIFSDCKKRISELQNHHEVRANEVLSILEDGSKNAFNVARQMTWDLSYDSWDLFPVAQKWFAAGEALAHLKYLETRGIVRREIIGQKTFFGCK